MLGYHIDVTSSHADKLMNVDGFIHRQTLASVVRFTTVALGELADKIGRAAGQALDLELKLFDDLVSEVLARSQPIALAADALASLDVAAGLGQLAEQKDTAAQRSTAASRSMSTGAGILSSKLYLKTPMTAHLLPTIVTLVAPSNRTKPIIRMAMRMLGRAAGFGF